MMSLPQSLALSSVAYALSLLSGSIAFAEGEVAQTAEVESSGSELETKAESLSHETAELPSTTFVSDGQPVVLESLGVTITPPASWEISTNTGSLSVVMREPRPQTPAYEKPRYQRNITVAAIHKASPIDEVRAAELKEEMIKQFGADPLVSNFQIIEHKFFNYRGKNDGLLVYSSLQIGEYPMMQMHVLVSGQEKQFLLTYTDMAERFTDANDGAFEAAWNSIISVDVTGESPRRQDQYLRYGAIAGGILLLGLIAYLFRRRAMRVDYAGEADAMIEDDVSLDSGSSSIFATLADGWRLSGGNGELVDDDLCFSTHAPRTRKSDCVSNY